MLEADYPFKQPQLSNRTSARSVVPPPGLALLPRGQERSGGEHKLTPRDDVDEPTAVNIEAKELLAQPLHKACAQHARSH